MVYIYYMHENENVFQPLPTTASGLIATTATTATTPATTTIAGHILVHSAHSAHSSPTFTPTPNSPFEFECQRCPKKWNRRDPLSTHTPECCPRCKSPSWDKPKQRRSKIPAAVLAAVAFTDYDWARIAGSIVETVHMIPEDDVEEALVAKLKRYFTANLSTC